LKSHRVVPGRGLATEREPPKAKLSVALLLVFVLKNECLTIPLVRSDVVDYKREAA
jgi:hypothetical protein